MSDHAGHADDPRQVPLRVLVYSDDRRVRDRVERSLGVRPVLDLPPLEIESCATQPAVLKRMDAGGVDLAILDGEAVPSGGIGLCRQLKNEIFQCPPVLTIIGRPQDAWLAAWALSDGTVTHPINPMALCDKVVALLRTRLAATGRNLATTS